MAATDRLVDVPSEVVDLLLDRTSLARAASVAELRHAIAKALRRAKFRTTTPTSGRLLVPEVFYDAARCDFYYRRLLSDPAGASFLIYDFIPWLQPQSIGAANASPLMPYLRLTQMARSLAFISANTRTEWSTRIRRSASLTGPVIPLGADSIAVEKQAFHRGRKAFVSIGSLDGRRNQHLTLRAFRELWESGLNIELIVIGHTFDPDHPVAAEIIHAARTETRLTYLPAATDEDIARAMRLARGTVYVSTVEGYGLPPLESLHIGIPVVVTASVPSISSLSDKGLIRIDRPEVEAIKSAIQLLADDDVAERLWRQAEEIKLPRWKDFAQGVQRWLNVE